MSDTLHLVGGVNHYSIRRGGRAAEGGGLLNRYAVNPVSRVRIPSPPPYIHFSTLHFDINRRKTVGILSFLFSQHFRRLQKSAIESGVEL